MSTGSKNSSWIPKDPSTSQPSLYNTLRLTEKSSEDIWRIVNPTYLSRQATQTRQSRSKLQKSPRRAANWSNRSGSVNISGSIRKVGRGWRPRRDRQLSERRVRSRMTMIFCISGLKKCWTSTKKGRNSGRARRKPWWRSWRISGENLWEWRWPHVRLIL